MKPATTRACSVSLPSIPGALSSNRNRAVHRDQVEALPELLHERPAHVVMLAAEPVEHEDRSALTALDIMDPAVLDRHELAARRHELLCLSRNPPRRIGEVAENENDDRQKDDDDDVR